MNKSGAFFFQKYAALSCMVLILLTPQPVNADWVVSTISGNGSPGYVDGPVGAAQFFNPIGVDLDSNGEIFIGDSGNHCIRRISLDQVVFTVAGNGFPGYVDGLAGEAQFNFPYGVAVAGDGTIFVADAGNNCIRSISPSGVVSTVAGSTTPGFLDGYGTNAGFNSPRGIAIHPDGTLYVSDTNNHAIRTISPDGFVGTLAGNGSEGWVDGTGAAARFFRPRGIVVREDSTVYVADSNNHVIRKISSNGFVSSFAGDGTVPGFVDGIENNALFDSPFGVTVGPNSNVYVCEVGNSAVRLISSSAAAVTIAGNGSPGFINGIGTNAQFNFPNYIVASPDGHLYLADSANHSIRTIEGNPGLFPDPSAVSIVDIPNDQGRQVSIGWNASAFDVAGSAIPITEYAIFRRIDDDLQKSETPMGFPLGDKKSDVFLKASQLLNAYPPGNWHFLASVPAFGEQEYSTVVPTLADSTIAGGIYYSSFFVRAGTATPTQFFDSLPDSGYSVDNLAPAAPTSLVMLPNDVLSWDDPVDADFNYFSVFGSDYGIFDGEAALIDNTINSTIDLTGHPYPYYHLTATDFSGNVSIPATVGGVSGLLLMKAIFSLQDAVPNPFNPQTTISFEIPEQQVVTLRVFDMSGRLVKNLITAEDHAPGRHEVIWDGEDDNGHRVASGTYMYRLNAGQFSELRKMTLVK